MPDFGTESLDAIARTDQLLDLLADQRRVRPADRAEDELFALLEDWRDDVRRPAMHRVTEEEAADALREGLAARAEKKRPRRGLAFVTSIAAAILAIGGFGALVGGAQPGDSLYGLRTALFGESQSVRDDKVTLAAQTEMAEVQRMIDQGDWEQAQQKLQAVSTAVQQVGNVDTKTDLIEQWNQLSVKVGTRDPNATLPVVVPGEPAAPPPPGVTLLELPPVTSTTVPSASTTSTMTSTTAPSSEGTATTTATSSTEITTTTESSVPSDTTSPVPAGGQPGTTTWSPTTESSPATEPAPATEAPPTSVPTATVPTTTTVAPALQSPVATVPTTTAPSTVTVAPSTVTVAPRTEESVTVPERTAVSVPNAGGSSGSNNGSNNANNNVVTSTMPRQVVELPIPGLG